MTARPTQASGNISARMMLRVVGYAAARGHDPDALCRSVGLSLRALNEEGARVPYACDTATYAKPLLEPRATRSTGSYCGANLARARAACSRLFAWDFDRLIVAHGEVIPSGAKELLRAALTRTGDC